MAVCPLPWFNTGWLEWYQLANEASQRQWQDVVLVLQLLRKAADLDYLRSAAESVGAGCGCELLSRLVPTIAKTADAAPSCNHNSIPCSRQKKIIRLTATKTTRTSIPSREKAKPAIPAASPKDGHKCQSDAGRNRADFAQAYSPE